MDFREELLKRGAREFHIVALGTDQDRAMAAIAEAERRGVESVIPYAMTLFEDPSWTPKSRTLRPQMSNLSVETQCIHCGGDRFVSVTAGLGLYEETYAPCVYCNKEANTTRWVGNERRTTAPR